MSILIRENLQSFINLNCNFLSLNGRINLEKGIFNASIQSANEKGVIPSWSNTDFIFIYKQIAKRVLSNCISSSYVKNEKLVERLKEGEFQPQSLAFMTSTELFPSHWEELAHKQIQRETTMLEGDTEGGSDMFKCKNCGKSKTRFYELQTRSADEPMTIFIRCLNCGKNWRQ